MGRHAFFVGRRLLAGCTAVALAAVIAVPQSAFGAERVVLGEFFTWTNCPACGVAEPVVDNMVDLYGANGSSSLSGRLALLTLHVWDGYEVPWGTARKFFYNPIFAGTPCFVHDGQYDAWPIDTYGTKFRIRANVPTPVTMTIYAGETTGDDCEVSVGACLETGAPPVDVRIYTVMAEDHYPVQDPDGTVYARNFFRAAAPTNDISLVPGQCAQVTNLITVLSSWELNNLQLVAWAQEPNNNWPADVHQAAIAPYPWDPAHPPCPWDCAEPYDGVVGVSDFLALLASWGGGGPCDTDGDGAGITDFLSMLAHWGDCPQ
jgi:hypothetical protein